MQVIIAMRKVTFPLMPAGSEKPNTPKTDELADWIKSVKGINADIISWEIETTLKDQIGAADICCGGGDFYRFRFDNLKNFDDVIADVHFAQRVCKNIKWSMPSPSDLGAADEDEISEFSKLYRDMRDAGVVSHILLCRSPTEIELEKFNSVKYLWLTDDSSIESVLEHSGDIAADVKTITRIESLFDSYDIRNIFVMDADRKTLENVLEFIDREHIFITGIAPEDNRHEYWKKLSEVSVMI